LDGFGFSIFLNHQINSTIRIFSTSASDYLALLPALRGNHLLELKPVNGAQLFE
jgi:hypothetical protein